MVCAILNSLSPSPPLAQARDSADADPVTLCRRTNGGAWQQKLDDTPFSSVAMSADGKYLIAASHRIAVDERNRGKVYISKSELLMARLRVHHTWVYTCAA
jgi:hypothetical protein